MEKQASSALCLVKNWAAEFVLRPLRRSPFSVMALCNIAGDCCYLGFAFYADSGLSLLKAAGALSAMVGHIILLAYGDKEAVHFAEEQGFAARAIQVLRQICQNWVMRVLCGRRIAKPVFAAFFFLAMNGVALLLEASARDDAASVSQLVMGGFIIAGCACFAAADLVRRQAMADILTKIGPSFFTCITVTSLALIAYSRNPFIIASFCLFLVANIAGFFIRIDKTAVMTPPDRAISGRER